MSEQEQMDNGTEENQATDQQDTAAAETAEVEAVDASVNVSDVEPTDVSVADATADGDAVESQPESQAVAAKEEPAVTAPVVPEAAPVENTVETYLRARFPKMRDIPRNTVTVIHRMEQYTTKMAKGRGMGPTDGAGHQRDLYYTFMTALGGPDDSVNPSLEAIAWYFQVNRNSCFAATHAYRFMNLIKLSKDESLCLQNLINLFVTCAEPGTRSITLKQVDLAKSTEKVKDLRAHDRLLAFFNAAR